MAEVEQNRLDTGVSDLAVRLAGSLGLELVDLQLAGFGDRSVLRIDLDRAGPEGINLDDCQRFSMAMEVALDDGDLIPHGYTLEVSSPGMDRAIASPDDIRRNTGRKVDAEVRTDDGNTIHAVGILHGVEDGVLILDPVEDHAGGRYRWTEVVRMQQFLPF